MAGTPSGGTTAGPPTDPPGATTVAAPPTAERRRSGERGSQGPAAGAHAPDRLRPPWTAAQTATVVGLGAGGAVVAWSFQRVGIAGDRLRSGWADLANLLDRMVPIKWPAFGSVAQPLADTLMMAVAGTALAVVISLPLSFLAARNTTPHPAVRHGARTVVLAARAVPDVAWALVLVRVLGVGVLPGVLALAAYSTGTIGKLFADAIEDVDPGVHEALISVGATRLQAIVGGVLPQAAPSFISSALYRLDLNVGSSAILGFVGAGGIGLELYTSLRTLQYPRGLGLAVLVVAVLVLVERGSFFARSAIVGQTGAGRRSRARRRPAATPPVPSPAPGRALAPPWTATRIRGVALSVLVLLAVAGSFLGLDIEPGRLLGAIGPLVSELHEFLPPDFAAVRVELPTALADSFAIAVAATVLALVLSLPVVFLAARNTSPHPLLYYPARYSVVVLRGLPPMLLAIVFVSAFGLGPFAGATALALGSIGMTAKLMADTVEHVGRGPVEAVRSTGATRLQEVTAAVVPQVAPSFVSTMLFALDMGIRSSIIVGIVGAGGIGFLLYQTVTTLHFEASAAVILTLLVALFLLDRLSDHVRRRVS